MTKEQQQRDTVRDDEFRQPPKRDWGSLKGLYNRTYEENIFDITEREKLREDAKVRNIAIFVGTIALVYLLGLTVEALWV